MINFGPHCLCTEILTHTTPLHNLQHDQLSIFFHISFFLNEETFWPSLEKEGHCYLNYYHMVRWFMRQYHIPLSLSWSHYSVATFTNNSSRQWLCYISFVYKYSGIQELRINTSHSHPVNPSKLKKLTLKTSLKPTQQWVFVYLASERHYMQQIKHLQKRWMPQRAISQSMSGRKWSDLWSRYHTWTNLYSRTYWVKLRKNLDITIQWVVSQFLATKMSSNA